MKNEVKNANNKKIGNIEYKDQKLYIQTLEKPLLVIEDIKIINSCYEIFNSNIGVKETGNNSKTKINHDIDLMITLYDKYYLTLGEIASVLNLSYHKSRTLLIKEPLTTKPMDNRRNRAYGKPVSETQSKRMSRSLKGREAPNYVRTKDVKQKISDTLKQNFKDGTMPDISQKLSEAWERGCYKDSTFGRGYQGYFTSLKFNKTFYFRSLLELCYILHLETSRYKEVEFEPFVIPIWFKSRNRRYTPDVLIDNKYLVEIKPKRHIFIHPKDKERFMCEVKGAIKYCRENNLVFKIITDEMLGFETDKFKRYLINNADILKKHKIRFTGKSISQ